MARLARILVHVDHASRRDRGVDAAVRVAERCRARLTLAGVVPAVPLGARGFVTRGVEQELLEHRREQLAGLAARMRHVRADTVVLRGQAGDALVQEAARGKYDLLVRSHHPGRAGGPLRPFGPTDMRLLRDCPCPVWLVGPPPGRRGGPVIAAVDASDDDKASRRLQAHVIDLGVEMHGFLGAPLVVLYAWSAFAEAGLRGHLSTERIAAYVAQSRALAARELRDVMRRGGARLAGVDAVLVKGEPERAIPAYARRRAAALVVIGTVGRSGLAGAIIGNTAERVLKSLRGSVLAVSPPRRRTPRRTR